MKFFLILLSLMMGGYNAHANFTVTKDGKTYECTEVAGGCWESCPYSFSTCLSTCGSGDGCWDECPYSFSTCQSDCGGGNKCWESCPYSFSTCQSECGGGSGCWASCPYSFSTCASECGNNVSPKLFEKFMNSNSERLMKEKADGIMPRLE